MRSKFAIYTFAAVLAGALLYRAAFAAETVRVGGTGTATGFLRQIAATSESASGVKIAVVSSLGSSGAIRALGDRRLEVAVSARPLKAAEEAAGVRQVAVFRTAFIFATSHRNPNGLNTADLPRIYAAEKSTWADGLPIRLILRPKSETDTDLLAALAPGMAQAIDAARRRAEVPIAATDQDNVEMAARIPGSLTTTTMTQLRTEGVPLQIVTLNGVSPTPENFESRAYPFAKKLYFISRTDSSPETDRFMEYLKSPEGLKALRDAAVLPEAE